MQKSGRIWLNGQVLSFPLAPINSETGFPRAFLFLYSITLVIKRSKEETEYFFFASLLKADRWKTRFEYPIQKNRYSPALSIFWR